jgi:hypothetical protein
MFHSKSSNREVNKNTNLDNIRTKKAIVNYVNKCTNNTPKSIYITDENHIEYIKDNDYTVGTTLVGKRVMIVIVKLDDIYYIVNYEKRTKYYFEKLKIHPIDISAHPNLYNGTIAEGIFSNTNSEFMYIIDEIYYLAGEEMIHYDKITRMNKLKDTINASIVQKQDITIMTAHIDNISKNSFEMVFDRIKSNNSIDKVWFYPNEFSLPTFIYELIDEDKYDDIYETNKFIIKKTINREVYELLDYNTKKKVANAYIPNTTYSKMYLQWFKAYKKKELVVICVKDQHKNKWYPIQVVD